jgi:RNA polymerase sigma factor (sigma-70 family)
MATPARPDPSPRPSDADAKTAHLRLVDDTLARVTEPDDDALLELWITGDRNAGNRLVKRYYLEITRYFMTAVGDQERRDLTSETFARLCKAIHRFNRQASVRSFIYGIARNVLNEFLRKRYKQLERVGEFDPDLHTIEDAGQRTPSRLISTLVRREVVVDCLRALPVEAKQMLELYYWHGMTADQVSDIFGIPPATVRTRLHHIKRRLQDKVATREPSLVSLDIEQQLGALGRLMGFGPQRIDE